MCVAIAASTLSTVTGRRQMGGHARAQIALLLRPHSVKPECGTAVGNVLLFCRRDVSGPLSNNKPMPQIKTKCVPPQARVNHWVLIGCESDGEHKDADGQPNEQPVVHSARREFVENSPPQPLL